MGRSFLFRGSSGRSINNVFFFLYDRLWRASRTSVRVASCCYCTRAGETGASIKKKRKEKEKTLRRHSAPFPGIFRRRRRRFPNSVPVTQSKSTSTSKLGPSAPFVGASEEGRGGGVKYSDENEKKNLKAKWKSVQQKNFGEYRSNSEYLFDMKSNLA